MVKSTKSHIRVTLGFLFFAVLVGSIVITLVANSIARQQTARLLAEEGEAVYNKQTPLVGFPSRMPVSVSPTPVPVDPSPENQSQSDEPWGVARQIDEVTWTMRIGQDQVMATPREIYEALNIYRQAKGSTHLSWDDRLANYAQSRADYFLAITSTDKHEGFRDFVENQDGFNKLGFNRLGENASFGYRLSGTHVIEWMYAADPYHDGNQLDTDWKFVGVGVAGTATALIFGR